MNNNIDKNCFIKYKKKKIKPIIIKHEKTICFIYCRIKKLKHYGH